MSVGTNHSAIYPMPRFMTAPTFASGLAHGFHLQSVSPSQSLRASTTEPTGPDICPTTGATAPGVVIQVRQKFLAIRVRLPQGYLAEHEALLNAVREPRKTHLLLFN